MDGNRLMCILKSAKSSVEQSYAGNKESWRGEPGLIALVKCILTFRTILTVFDLIFSAQTIK